MPRCGAPPPGLEPEVGRELHLLRRLRASIKSCVSSSLNCAAFCLRLRSGSRRVLAQRIAHARPQRSGTACVNPLRSNEKTRRLLDLSEAIG
jgi:hypothetical protein